VGKAGPGVLIVVLVIALFLWHLKSSLVLLISLPLGVLMAYLVMYLQGINANIMSLGGIAISIGVMVDAAIVLIENVHGSFERDPPEFREQAWAAIDRGHARGRPADLLFAADRRVSFLPVFALQAQEGRMFAPLAFTKTYAMAAAAGLAVTLVPVLMGYFVTPGKAVARKGEEIPGSPVARWPPAGVSAAGAVFGQSSLDRFALALCWWCRCGSRLRSWAPSSCRSWTRVT
jgi:copper/silver efflux system protein